MDVQYYIGVDQRMDVPLIAEHVAEVRCAVVYQKPQSTIDCAYVWRRTDRWIDFPWSAPS